MENLYVSYLHTYTYINIVVDTWIAHKKSAITQMCYEIDRKLLWSGGKDNQLIVSIIITLLLTHTYMYRYGNYQINGATKMWRDLRKRR